MNEQTRAKEPRFVREAQKVFSILRAVVFALSILFFMIGLGSWGWSHHGTIFSKTAVGTTATTLSENPVAADANFVLKKDEIRYAVWIEKTDSVRIWSSKPFVALSGYPDGKTAKEFLMPAGKSRWFGGEFPGFFTVKGAENNTRIVLWKKRR